MHKSTRDDLRPTRAPMRPRVRRMRPAGWIALELAALELAATMGA